MEYVVLLVLLLGFWLLREFWQNRSATERDNARASPPDEEWDSRAAKRALATHQQQAPSPAPFDASSAHKAKTDNIISGFAYVIDGDTIRINKAQIRLYGIDAPEMNHPYGIRAKRAMMRLCKQQRIRAEVTDTDDHGRSVAKCTLPDGRDLSAELVKLGLAIDWPKFSGGIYKPLEPDGVRKKLWLADARQKGRMDVWERYDAQQAAKAKSQ